MISDLLLMKIQVDTLFVHDNDERLRFINEPFRPEDHPAPVVFIGRTRCGSVVRFRYDIPEALCQRVQTIIQAQPLSDNLYESPSYLAKVKDLLTPHITMDRQWMGPAYRFPDSLGVSPEVVQIDRDTAYLFEFGFSDLVPELDHCQPVVAIVEGDKAVSVCQSVRKSVEAEEAGVDTLLSHRGKGYAAQVVAGWAGAVRKQGRIPLYSTSWDNRASQRVAEKLGLRLYGVDFHIS
ncbi:MAG: GNAT family N-acetyltransferase [Gemmatimonadetes bacterium]|nr:GNAT family N-acetyltransferase [Gemmatimonadota bacterium]MYB54917.1 GNAT family N-acetyltransferase [Gemmatimonadota bacterium]